MKAAISPKLRELASYFDKRRNLKTEITAASSAMLAEQLEILAAMALSMETELDAFRLIEANRAGRRFMEDEAGEAMKTTIVRGDGKVLRPDFGRKA